MEIKNLLHKEIKDEFQHLSGMELGSETYKATVDGISKLVEKAIELDKFDAEQQEKQEQAHEEKIDRWVRNGIAIGGIVVPTLVTIWGTVKSFEFEKTGTITTVMGRGFINKLLPRK